MAEEEKDTELEEKEEEEKKSLISGDDYKEIEESLTSDEDKTSLKAAKELLEKKILDGSQKRWNKVTLEKYGYKDEAEAQRKEKEIYQAKLLEIEKKEAETKKTTTVEGKPKLEDYDDVAAHTEALIEWNRKQEREYYDAKIKKIETDRAKSAQEIREQEIEEEFARGRKDYKDFDAVAKNQKLPYNDMLRDIVLDLKDARHIEYYLGTHIDEVERLSRLPEREALLEIGKIQAKLTKPKSKDSKDKEVVTSEVAEVINPVEGNEIVSKADDKLSIAELRKKYNW